MNRTTIRRIALAAALPLGLAACAAGVMIPDPARVASVILEKGYGEAKLLGGSANMYFLETGAGACEGLQRIGSVDWRSGSEVRKSLPAGAPVKIYGEVIISTDGGYNAVIDNRCAQRGSFTPEIGKTYRIRQAGALGAACTLSVIDAETGQAPADYRAVPTDNCKNW
jgi:hypothetical protein